MSVPSPPGLTQPRRGREARTAIAPGTPGARPPLGGKPPTPPPRQPCQGKQCGRGGRGGPGLLLLCCSAGFLCFQSWAVLIRGGFRPILWDSEGLHSFGACCHGGAPQLGVPLRLASPSAVLYWLSQGTSSSTPKRHSLHPPSSPSKHWYAIFLRPHARAKGQLLQRSPFFLPLNSSQHRFVNTFSLHPFLNSCTALK